MPWFGDFAIVVISRTGESSKLARRIFGIKSQGGPTGLGSMVIKCHNITLVHVYTRFRVGDGVAKEFD